VHRSDSGSPDFRKGPLGDIRAYPLALGNRARLKKRAVGSDLQMLPRPGNGKPQRIADVRPPGQSLVSADAVAPVWRRRLSGASYLFFSRIRRAAS